MADALHKNVLSECTLKKKKTSLRLFGKIPVWICEYHQEVLPYIYRAIASKHLPFEGITMLHFDSHPDLMAPLDFKADNVYNKDFLFDVLSIADWILPAVYVGHIKKVIWIKPPWATQIEDKTIFLHVGRHKKEGTIRVSSCEKYFCEDDLYSPLEELENCKELMLLVVTMYFDDGQKDCTHKLYNNENNEELSQHEKSEVTCCNIEQFISGLSSQLEESFILDIDMDFFSTLNPFEVMFTKEEFEVLRGFYLFPRCKSGDQQIMHEASQEHKKNVEQLEATLTFLKQTENDGGNSNNVAINYKFLEFIKKWKNCANKTIDYDLVHSAGMTTELPVHISEEQEILKMMSYLQNVLISLPKPTIITVARSSDDDYTPRDSVEIIQFLLLKCLKRSYNNDIECFLTYKDDE